MKIDIEIKCNHEKTQDIPGLDTIRKRATHTSEITSLKAQKDIAQFINIHYVQVKSDQLSRHARQIPPDANQIPSLIPIQPHLHMQT